uniref:EGF-like domain-containing protein n=1 Tax=Biomphalaria glabrata TaxID=6526 RepID=A0A2C9LMF1_BIOGL
MFFNSKVLSRRTMFRAVITLSACLLVLTGATSIFDFDCRRQGSECLNHGTCNDTSGECICIPAAPASNYRCANITSDCPEGNYGESCTLQRVQVDCTYDAMYVNINPYGDPQFQGYIYVYGYDKPGECIFIETGNITIPPFVKNSTLLKGYGIELKHIGSKCGDPTSKN